MSILNDPVKSNLFIPNIVKLGKLYFETNEPNRHLILKGQESLDIIKYILFYAELFKRESIPLSFDDFNWVPLTYPEIIMLSTYGNTFNTLMKDDLRLYPNIQTVRYL